MPAQPPPLTSRFGFRNPALWFARATLLADHLELNGWHRRGRYARRIPLTHILQADVQEHDGLLLWLADGETIRLRIDRAAAWKAAIEARTGNDLAEQNPQSSPPIPPHISQ